MKTIIIHLARATGRRAHVDWLRSEAPFPAEVLDATDGRELATWPVEPRFSPRYPFDLVPGEVGCFLSHRRAWQQILDNGLDYALVLEDDVHLAPGFAETVRVAADHIDALGFIQFNPRPYGGPSQEVARTGDITLLRPQVVPLRLSAQLIHRKAAARLVELTETFDRPVDTLLQMTWQTGVPISMAQPAHTADRTAETGGSNISTRKRPLHQNIAREIKRAIYRARIAHLSRRAATGKGSS